ncbi:MAG: hypothetical protein JO040_01125 [Gemmatimonadetes bacterium]|nr:hypothetical protein [Gemmatimonadota bacterium]
MSYIIRGTLRGFLCSDCVEPLSGMTLRLYPIRQDPGTKPGDPEDPKRTFAVLDQDAVKARGPLLGEGKTDEAGRFSIEIGDSRGYDGGALEVDLYCGNVPHHPGPPRRDPVQVMMAVLRPEWSREEKGEVFRWDHDVSYRLWCWLRGLFDAWVICGHVRNCKTREPLAGLKVSAFDVDWLQDDALGNAVTGPDGHFRIDYTSAAFRTTIFSPLINVELTGGPDVYFRVESSGGAVLLNEPSSRGRKPDRENRGPCFCVDLCVDADPPPPYDNPLFTNVGNFHILADIDSATGLANKTKLGVGGNGWGWFGDLKLRGYCPKTKPGTGEQMYYRFLYSRGGTEHPVTGGLLADVLVGSRLIQWDLDGNGTMDWVFQDVIISGAGATADLPTPPVVPPGTPWGAPPPHVVVPDADGWIRVDPRAIDGGFYGPLVQLRSYVVVPVGPTPSNGPNAAVADPKNGELVTLIFETTTDPANAALTERQVAQPTLLVNNWEEVRELNLLQFTAPGANACSKLGADLNILYTVDHQLIAEWALGISSAASPWSAPVLPSGNTPRGQFGNQHVSLAGWPPCSYTVSLSSRRKLTNGEGNDDANSSSLTFCIC